MTSRRARKKDEDIKTRERERESEREREKRRERGGGLNCFSSFSKDFVKIDEFLSMNFSTSKEKNLRILFPNSETSKRSQFKKCIKAKQFIKQLCISINKVGKTPVVHFTTIFSPNTDCKYRKVAKNLCTRKLLIKCW
jgi:hypothetical protein